MAPHPREANSRCWPYFSSASPPSTWNRVPPEMTHLMADALLEGAAAAEADAGQDEDQYEEPELVGAKLVLMVLPLAVEEMGKLG